MAVVRVEERLHGPVARAGLFHELERAERNLFLELRSRAGGEVRHLAVRRGAARGPLPHLANAVGGLALEHLGDAVEVHRERSQSRTSPALRSGGNTG